MLRLCPSSYPYASQFPSKCIVHTSAAINPAPTNCMDDELTLLSSTCCPSCCCRRLSPALLMIKIRRCSIALPFLRPQRPTTIIGAAWLLQSIGVCRLSGELGQPSRPQHHGMCQHRYGAHDVEVIPGEVPASAISGWVGYLSPADRSYLYLLILLTSSHSTGTVA